MKIFSVIAGASEPSSGAVGYLGPPGTFTHQILLADPELVAREHVPLEDAESVVTAVERGTVELGVLPWENSVAGAVGLHVDLLACTDRRIGLRLDLVLPVRFCLWTRQGASLEDVAMVTSHPHALDQSRRWLRQHMPDAILVPASSTVAGQQAAAADLTGRTAAVAPYTTASLVSGVRVLASDIGEDPRAETRFVVMGRELPAPRSESRTVLACFQPANRPGSLLRILEPFASAGVNLLRIESRPTKREIGDYYFLLECSGDPRYDMRLGTVLGELDSIGVTVRLLGVLAGARAGRPVAAAVAS